MKTHIVEADVLQDCKFLLALLQNQGKLLFRRIHTTAIPRGTNAEGKTVFSKNTDMKGLTDLLIFLPNGLVIHPETKKPGGKLSEAQLEWKTKLEALGHKFYKIEGLQDLVNALEDNGVETGLKRK